MVSSSRSANFTSVSSANVVGDWNGSPISFPDGSGVTTEHNKLQTSTVLVGADTGYPEDHPQYAPGLEAPPFSRAAGTGPTKRKDTAVMTLWVFPLSLPENGQEIKNGLPGHTYRAQPVRLLGTVQVLRKTKTVRSENPSTRN